MSQEMCHGLCIVHVLFIDNLLSFIWLLRLNSPKLLTNLQRSH